MENKVLTPNIQVGAGLVVNRLTNNKIYLEVDNYLELNVGDYVDVNIKKR